MELVIMAAGLGSRFGGLKQLEPIDNNGNFIIDYSVFDAIRCGFNKVIFIIKKENLNLFRETIGKRIESKIETEYVFQDNSNIPGSYTIPDDRQKPFGTGHAVLCAKDAISSNFAVINADDFYGFDAFKSVASFLKNNTNPANYCLIGYPVENTLSSSGAVNRGVCNNSGGTLTSITESKISKENGLLLAKPLSSPHSPEYQIASDTPVSMNMFGFSQNFLDGLNNHFFKFLEHNKRNLSSCEFFLPTVVSNMIEEKTATVSLIKTCARWYGITYKEDKEEIVNAIIKMKNEKIYPNNLWQK
ncbi:MAG: nucleotidyltransferase [Clostridia bacterium]|nr:nucleotidyltransferase [Clostridia bacterium]